MKKNTVQDRMIVLKDLIGQGATRECYLHPFRTDKCVKVLKKSSDTKILEKEIKAYLKVKYVLDDLIPDYDMILAETDKGKGLVCELFRDDNGKLSKTIGCYLRNGKLEKDIIRELYYFVYQLVEHDLYFYDFNLKNFVVQIKNGQKKLKYIDLKSYDNYKSWTFLKLEKIFAFLAKIIMQRRLQRLFKMLGIKKRR